MTTFIFTQKHHQIRQDSAPGDDRENNKLSAIAINDNLDMRHLRNPSFPLPAVAIHLLHPAPATVAVTQIRCRQRQRFLFAESLRQIMADRVLRPSVTQRVRRKFARQPHFSRLPVPVIHGCFKVWFVDQPAIASIRNQ